MNVFLRELRANRKSLLIWSIAFIAMIIGGMSKFGGFSTDSGTLLNDMMQNMPKSLLAIMGVVDLDLSKASGFFGMLFLYLVLMGTVHAVMLGSGIVSKEERDQTAEFLFVKPISRTTIITAKLCAALVNVLIVNAVAWITAYYVLAPYQENEEILSILFALMIGLLLLQLLFLAIGSAISGLSHKPKRTTSISTAILLVTFFLSIGIDLSGKLDALRFFTPFKYVEARHIISGDGYEPVLIVLMLILTVVAIVATYIGFRKRDLQL